MDTLSRVPKEFSEHLRSRAIPAGSLGRLEQLALQIATIQGKKCPAILQPHLLLFLGDHGLTLATEKEEDGRTSAFSSAITISMCEKYRHGVAAANILCRAHGVDFFLINAGMQEAKESPRKEPPRKESPRNEPPRKKRLPAASSTSTSRPVYFDIPVAAATQDCRTQEAMTAAQLRAAFQAAKEIVQSLAQETKRAQAPWNAAPASQSQSCNTVLIGEMGIGNTAIASLLHAIATGTALEDCTGAGAGLSQQGVEGKIRTLQICKSRWESVRRAEHPQTWGTAQSLLEVPASRRSAATMALLASCGGFEIAMMVSAILQAAQQKLLIVLDGYISTVAYLFAWLMQPEITDHTILSHLSKEQGHSKLSHLIQKQPLLDLQLGLGEGSGALLAMPLLQSTCKLMSDLDAFPQ